MFRRTAVASSKADVYFWHVSSCVTGTRNSIGVHLDTNSGSPPAAKFFSCRRPGQGRPHHGKSNIINYKIITWRGRNGCGVIKLRPMHTSTEIYISHTPLSHRAYTWQGTVRKLEALCPTTAQIAANKLHKNKPPRRSTSLQFAPKKRQPCPKENRAFNSMWTSTVGFFCENQMSTRSPPHPTASTITEIGPTPHHNPGTINTPISGLPWYSKRHVITLIRTKKWQLHESVINRPVLPSLTWLMCRILW